MLAKSWGREQCWVLVLVVGGRGWAVTFRASWADRKDKNGGKKRKKKNRRGLAIVPRKRSPDQACDLPSSSWWLTFGVMGDAGIHLSILSYELQPGTKVCLADRASSNHDHLKHTEISGERPRRRHAFFPFFPKMIIPLSTCHMLSTAYFFPSAAETAATRHEGRQGGVRLWWSSEQERKRNVWKQNSAGHPSLVFWSKQLWF